MKALTATHVKYYHLCYRKLWLFDHDVWMEHTSEAVAAGELLHQMAYPQRAERYREISIGGSKIDFYDPQRKVVHELKKSNKMVDSDTAQVKYYLWLLEAQGVDNPTGILEYPKLRQTQPVALTDEDRARIPQELAAMRALLADDTPCPPVINKPFCKQCAYYEFCYVAE
jgi:CRISPR-associated exonuclease Cas4